MNEVRRASFALRVALLLSLGPVIASCSPRQAADQATTSAPAEQPPSIKRSFSITWPLTDPFERKKSKSRTLLQGSLLIETQRPGSPRPQLHLSITLTRPDDNEYREFWNQRLMYKNLAWMDRVRVWDKERKWLYPNLAFLFKLHGVDRVDRYGGWDPGKQVDNDFGAVLIRVLDGDSQQELPQTLQTPLVSARWHAVPPAQDSRYAIVHQIRSDEFTIGVGAENAMTPLRVQVWLVYGDFMGNPAPRHWPTELEAAGGALAYFVLDWNPHSIGSDRLVTQQRRPVPTGFDWTGWIDRPSEEDSVAGHERLSVTLRADEG